MSQFLNEGSLAFGHWDIYCCCITGCEWDTYSATSCNSQASGNCYLFAIRNKVAFGYLIVSGTVRQSSCNKLLIFIKKWTSYGSQSHYILRRVGGPFSEWLDNKTPAVIRSFCQLQITMLLEESLRRPVSYAFKCFTANNCPGVSDYLGAFQMMFVQLGSE